MVKRPLYVPSAERLFKTHMMDRVTLLKRTETGEDDWGNPIISTTEYEIQCVTLPLTAADLVFLPPGVAEVGDLDIFILTKYVIDGTDVIVEPKDRIKYGGEEYEITYMTDVMHGPKTIARRILCRRITIGG